MKLLRVKGKNSPDIHIEKKYILYISHIQGREVKQTSYFPRITFNARKQ